MRKLSKDYLAAEFNLSRRVVVHLISHLVSKRVPLASVYNGCTKMCKGLGEKKRSMMCNMIMKWKLADAQKHLNKEKRDNTRIWREEKRTLSEEGIEQDFIRIWEEEKEKQIYCLIQKKNKKVSFLKEKYRNMNSCDDEDIIEGIVIKDQQLTEEYESNPRCYGGIELSEEEKDALSLNPRFVIFNTNIQIEEVEAEIEKSITKIRWSRMNEGDEETNDQRGDQNQEQDQGKSEERMWPLDIERNHINYSALRPTDLPFNKRVIMPPNLKMDEEITLNSLKKDLIDVTKDYAQRLKNTSEEKKSNLTANERKGIKKLKEREDVVIMQTDKSGRFSVDTKENYKESCKTHIENDAIVSEEEHESAQNIINAHSILWTRMLRAGKNYKEGGRRVKNNMTVRNHSLAPLYSLRKDHKNIEDREKGPPTRPVCAASNAYNNRLSHLISTILRPVWQNQQTTCTSTEEMIAAIEEANENIDERTTIGSADVKALYPSLDIDFTAEKVSEMFLESELTVDVDSKELGLYLSLNMTKDEIEQENLSRYCPERRKTQGRKPTITGCAVNDNDEIRYGPWKEPEMCPDESTKKKMMATALKIVIKFIMKNHLYVFDNEIRKQMKGGPIGLELTGDVAQIVMAWWDKELLRRIREEDKLEVIMYKRYVDDIDTALRAKQNINGPTDNTEEKDVTNMNMLKEIANKIHESIQVEIDTPSMHEDNKLPILDLKVWIENIPNRGYYILHEFYCKNIASKSVIHARSSIPWANKRTILTQEVLRIMLNCSRKIPWSTVANHINQFMAKMQYSGYTKKFRGEVVKSALKAMKNLIRKEENNERPIHRPKGWKKKERTIERREKKANWFKKGGNETVVFIPATKGSELKRSFQEVIKRSKVKMKVVEKTTRSIKSVLVKQDPFTKKTCNDQSCMVCKACGTENSSISCRVPGVTYKITCRSEGCRAVYIGETSGNGYTRGEEHQRALNGRHPSSPLWKHALNAHGGIIPDFVMKVTGIFRNDATLRQITEAVKINNTTSSENIMNDRSEWGHTPLTRTIIERI